MDRRIGMVKANKHRRTIVQDERNLNNETKPKPSQPSNICTVFMRDPKQGEDQKMRRAESKNAEKNLDNHT